ncbi:hypothetical protein PASE110613_00080 [Paenibacillus sediminis]|uniref:Uncharacterized protein n=1 Tax=Paenibacillus sediminis TaxID=664909 RepID=A0ABS4H0H6_9BACL|nr:hypothetical protein [Paenibacillus sediminis]MBP1936024.1 hypothetical protein [Paenibacillus sediminis]
MKKNKILSVENQYGKNRLNLQVDFLKELDKDKWDVRILGIPYNHSISFEHIPEVKIQLIATSVQKSLALKISCIICSVMTGKRLR